MPSQLAPSTKRSLGFALAVVLIVGAGLAWQLWGTGRVTVEGELREGSLRCDNECAFELIIEGDPETTVRADSCIMPDTLRDWPGQSLHVLAAGKWEGPRRLLASAVLTKEGYFEGKKPSGGRPAACFIPPASR